MNDHFSFDHKKTLMDKNIEFMCKKGRMGAFNQDNLFILQDGDIKIFGLFDGHGINGHKVSGFVAGMMLDYIRNLSNGFFSKHNLEKFNMTKAIN